MTTVSFLESPRRRVAFLALLPALCAALVYVQVLDFAFINMDDDLFVYDNPYVKLGLSPVSLRWAWEAGLVHISPYLDYWQPVTVLSRLVDAQVYGLNPTGHHFTNLLLHALNTSLFFLLLFRMTSAAGPSLLAAALFAVHPAHAESVAWVSERKDVLFLFFGLLSLHALVTFLRTGRLAWAVLGTLAHTASLLSKPGMAPLPFLLLFLVHWPLGGFRSLWRRWLAVSLPLMALSTVTVLLIARRSLSGSFGLPDPVFIVVNTVHTLSAFVERFLVPVAIPFAQPWGTTEMSHGRFAAALFVVCLVSAVSLLEARRRPWLVTGWAWFLAGCYIMQGIREETPSRLTYLPYLGLNIMAAWTAREAWDRLPRLRRFLPAAALLIVAAYGFAGWREASYWKNSVTRFQRALEVNPRNGAAWRGLGVALLFEKRHAEALAALEQGLAANPTALSILLCRGVVLDEIGDEENARATYLEVLRSRPDYDIALYNLGLMAARHRRWDEAAHWFSTLLTHRPDHILAVQNLAPVQVARGAHGEALALYERVLAFHSDPRLIRNNRAMIHFLDGRFDLMRVEAERGYDTADGLERSLRYLMSAMPGARDTAVPALAWARAEGEGEFAEAFRRVLGDSNPAASTN